MPSLHFPIPVLDDAISTAVGVQAFNYIKDRLSLGAETELVYAGDMNVAQHPGTNLSDTNDDPYISDRHRVFLVTREKPVEDLPLTSPISYREEHDLMYDKDIGWKVTPVYARTEMQLEFRYRAATKHQTDRFGADFHARLMKATTSVQMELKYEYPIPEHILAIIQVIHAAREANKGYGDDFSGPGQYLEQCIKFPYSYKTNMAGNYTTLVFRPNLFRVLGVFASNVVPDSDREEDGTYSIGISMSFRYDKVTQAVIHYPIWVHNNFINNRYFDTEMDRNNELKIPVKYSGNLMGSFNWIENRTRGKIRSTTGYILPGFDDWFVYYPRQKTQDIFQMLVKVDPADPTLILDLNTLFDDTGLMLHPQMIPALIKAREKVFYENRSPISFALFNHQQLLHPYDYYLTDTGQLRSHEPLNERHHYHLKMGALRCLELINEVDWADWYEWGHLIIDIIDFIDWSYPKHKLLPLNPDGSIDILPHLPEINPGPKVNPALLPNMVKRPIMATVNSVAVLTYSPE